MYVSLFVHCFFRLCRYDCNLVQVSSKAGNHKEKKRDQLSREPSFPRESKRSVSRAPIGGKNGEMMAEQTKKEKRVQKGLPI